MIDVGRLTHDETVELWRDCAAELTDETIIELICGIARADDVFREELIASLEEL